MALKTVGFSLRDTWQELWTILIIHLFFLLGNVLILPGPPATLALFFYANRIAHGETADERDFLQAVRRYWWPAWRWALANLLVIGVLAGDYSLTGRIAAGSKAVPYIQGLYLTFLAGWLLLQLFVPPFLFEQERPSVLQALRNALLFIGKNLGYVLALTFLMMLSLTAGTLAFMLTFVFGGAFVAFASNRAVLERIPAP
jgi:hypothetical protein